MSRVWSSEGTLADKQLAVSMHARTNALDLRPQGTVKSSVSADQSRVDEVRKGLECLQGTWYLLRLSNMSTIIREWEALHAISHLSFRDTFLSGRTAHGEDSQRLHIPPVSCLLLSGLALISMP